MTPELAGQACRLALRRLGASGFAVQALRARSEEQRVQRFSSGSKHTAAPRTAHSAQRASSAGSPPEYIIHGDVHGALRPALSTRWSLVTGDPPTTQHPAERRAQSAQHPATPAWSLLVASG